MFTKQFVALSLSFLTLVTLAIWGLVLLRKNWGPRGVPLGDATAIFKIVDQPGSYVIVYRTDLGEEVRMRINPDVLSVVDVNDFVSQASIPSLFQKIPIEVTAEELHGAMQEFLYKNSLR